MDESRRSLLSVVAALGLAAGFFVIWTARDAVLLAFGAFLLSLLLRLLTGRIGLLFRLPRFVALPVAVLLVASLLGLVLWVCGTTLAAQFGDVVHRMHAGHAHLQNYLRHNGIDPTFLDGPPLKVDKLGVLHLTAMTGEVVVILLIAAIYMAAEPHRYGKGILTLFPRRIRPQAKEVLSGLSNALELWLLGQLVLMTAVGIGSYLALLVLGVPNALLLALLSGLAEAVPYIGPFIGAVPALLVASTHGLAVAMWTAGAYLGLHLIEGYLLGPALQRWFMRIPPAVILSGFLACQLLFGTAGLLLATPLTIALYAAIQLIYRHGVLAQPAGLPPAPPLEP